MILHTSIVANMTPEELSKFVIIELPNKPGFVSLRNKPRNRPEVTLKRKNSTNALMLAEANLLATKELSDPIRRMRWEERHQKAKTELKRHGHGSTAPKPKVLSNPAANRTYVPLTTRQFVISELMQGRPLD